MRNSISKYIKELSKELLKANNIVIISHMNPDGDAIGSMLGLAHYLRFRNKSVSMISPNSLQKFLLWMDGADDILIFSDLPGSVVKHISSADLVVYLDFNDESRIGNLASMINERGIRSVMIDHHPSPMINADIVVSEPGMSSTSEIIFEIVAGLEGEYYLDRSFMESVFVGMMTDTGNFNFGTFDGDTLRTVALMLDAGLRKDYITDHIYNNFSAGRMKLLGYALGERMVVLPAYHTAYIYLSRADLDRFVFAEGDTEGFVNMPLSIDGIVFSVLFMERGNHIKLSLRSKGDFSVNDFAAKHFRGGGHFNASGGKSPLELTAALALFESLLPSYERELELAYEKGK